ncbi:hypothetical protein CKO42_26720 [Lamprobacter modestohalophilus]|uniref:Uncharacterized protein n=1 Tax=Lamprobacter modestohalophilus TaxID=1064514 RepID=A0A9X0WEF5_9GAMM|nr:hypothetical protein [Lamprobacter modestohalophilus]MBK1621896.1 hypothetical protein [Lamprobacter modestohalophilus]
MTLSMDPVLIGRTETRSARLGVEDPLLQELWAIKADLNAAAGYSVERLAVEANTFDLEAKLTSLQQAIQDGQNSRE